MDMQGGELARWPQVLPGSKGILFTSSKGNIEVFSLREKRRKIVQPGGLFGRYVPSGHLLYLDNGQLFAVAFDLHALETRGAPKRMLDHVAYSSVDLHAQVDVSPSGTLVYRSGGLGQGLLSVQWLDPSGKLEPLLAKPDSYLNPWLSPDGHRLTFYTTGVKVFDAQRDTTATISPDGARYPVWTPDGRFIVFGIPGEGLFWARSDGAGQPELLLASKIVAIPSSFTGDGRRLAYTSVDLSTTGWDIWTVTIDNDGTALRAGKPETFLQTQFNELYANFSPDGRWLAYASDESGIYEIYVRAFPDKGGKWRISTGGAVQPMFSNNGRELLFRNLQNQLLAVNYTVQGDSFVPEKPRLWSERMLASLSGSNYDISPDGKRVAALMPIDTAAGQQHHVVFLLNFLDELTRTVPPAK